MASRSLGSRSLVSAVSWIALGAGVGCIGCGSSTASETRSTADGLPSLPEAAASGPDDGASDRDRGAAPPNGDAGPGQMAADPLNCGAPGHDCLGQACVGGVCAPEPIAQTTLLAAVAVGSADLVLATKTNPIQLLRGGKTPGVAFTPVPGPTIYREYIDFDLRIGGGYVYFAQLEFDRGTLLKRRPLAGTAATSDESIVGAAGSVGVLGYDVDDQRAVFATWDFGSTTWWRSHQTTTSTPLTASPSDPAAGDFRLLSIAGDSVFGLDGETIRDVPFALGASSVAGSLPSPARWSGRFVATDHAFYGARQQYQSLVSCESTVSDVWVRSRSTGKTTIVFEGEGFLPKLRADGKGAIYAITACAGTASKIVAHRSDGATYTVATFDAPDGVFTMDETWVYFTRASEQKLYRVAR